MTLAGWPQAASETLATETPAFLLGCVAPDAQTISGQAREATHFFYVPFRDRLPACRHLLAAYPTLAQPRGLSRTQAAFMSGYMTHLVLDEFWVQEIFEPIFGPYAHWGVFPERLYLHNALRSYLDAADLKKVPATTAAQLHAVHPRGLCPFLSDDTLLHWRDWLAEQLTPGQASQTVRVFAERMGADPGTFAALLASPQAMQRRVFARLPEGALEDYYRRGLALCVDVVERYWAGTL